MEKTTATEAKTVAMKTMTTKTVAQMADRKDDRTECSNDGDKLMATKMMAITTIGEDNGNKGIDGNKDNSNNDRWRRQWQQ